MPPPPSFSVVRDGLVDHWREMLRLLSGQVNQSGGVGETSEGLLAKISLTLFDPDGLSGDSR
jgi:hypothetical protein